MDRVFGIITTLVQILLFTFILLPSLVFLLVYQGGLQNLLAWAERLQYVKDMNELRTSGLMYMQSLQCFFPITLFSSYTLCIIFSFIYE